MMFEDDGIKEVDVMDVFMSLIEAIEKMDYVDKVEIYDGESIEDLQNSVKSIRPGKFANVYIDYLGGQPYNSNQTQGVDEDMKFALYVIGKRDVTSYDRRLRNTASVCYLVKKEIYKHFYMKFIDQPFYFPTVLGPFRKYFNNKFVSENVSCYVQEINYKACIYKVYNYNVTP